MKLVILERNSVGTDISMERYQEFGEVVSYPNTVSEEETAERIKDADIVIANKAPINERTLRDAARVKLICEFATGYDNVDVDYCRSRGIAAANIRDYSTPAVAQHTFAMALFLTEHLHFYDNYVKSGAYSAQGRFSNFDMAYTELEGKTWGIAGMGNIGRKVARIAESFGCHVIFYATSGYSECKDYERVEFDELLTRSDYLSLHCPLTDRTRDLINAAAFAKMKQTAVLLNVARGPVVNNADLYEALVSGRIAAAGLDVLEKEPLRTDNPLSQFLDSNRLIITPHMAWASTEARERCAAGVYDNIKAFLEGHPIHLVTD